MSDLILAETINSVIKQSYKNWNLIGISYYLKKEIGM